VVVATDDGVALLDEGAGADTELAGRRVHGLARHRDEWWAIADRHTVVQRDGDGAWHDVAEAEPRLTSVLPAPGGAWCGTVDGHLLRLHGGALVAADSFDGVDGQERWHAVGSRVPYVRSLTSTSDGRALLVNVHVGGIPRSGNGGATWKPTIDPDADVHQVRAHPSDPSLVLAPAAVGLGVSRDAGASWDVVTEGLHATYLRAVAYTTGNALVSACDGPFGSHGALYRWDTLSGGALVRVDDGLPEWLAGNVDTGMLDAHQTAAAFADQERIYASSDAGSSWEHLATDLGAVNAVGVSAD